MASNKKKTKPTSEKKPKLPGTPGGGPRRLTEEELVKVEAWSQVRHPIALMATMLGMSESSLTEIFARDADARYRLEVGRANGRDLPVRTAYQQATQPREVTETHAEMIPTGKTDAQGQPILQRRVKKVTKVLPPDPSATRFWLQTQEGFKSTQALELTGKDGAPIATDGGQETKEAILAELAELQEIIKERMAGEE